jgi:hypothetical protein
MSGIKRSFIKQKVQWIFVRGSVGGWGMKEMLTTFQFVKQFENPGFINIFVHKAHFARHYCPIFAFFPLSKEMKNNNGNFSRGTKSQTNRNCL